MHATLIKAYPLVTPVPAACNAVYLFQLHTGYLVELMRRTDCCHCEAVKRQLSSCLRFGHGPP